jgi:putative membrane protein
MGSRGAGSLGELACALEPEHLPDVQHSSLVVAVVHLLLTGLSVLLVGKVLPGVRVKSFGSAVAFAFVVGILNAVAWTLLAPLSITFSVLTLGLGALVINGVLFLLADAVIAGVEISGCFTAALASLGVTFFNWAMHFVLGRWAP